LLDTNEYFYYYNDGIFYFSFLILSIFLTGYWLRETILYNIVKNSAETRIEELQFDLFHYTQGKI